MRSHDGLKRTRPSREERLQWLDEEIRAHRYPDAQRMAANLGISRRTAFSDCAHLRHTLNAPIAWDTERQGWHYTDPAYALPLLYLSAPEVAAVRRTLLAAQEFLGEADAEPLRRLSERLAPFLPEIAVTTRESVGGSLHPYPDATTAPELFSACEQAVKRRQKLHLLYHGTHRNQETERTVRPYHLHNHQGEWWLIAHCELRKDIRTFLLGRVAQWRLLDEDAAFRTPPDFDAEALITQGLFLEHGGETVIIRIRFDSYQARWIRERKYHPTQIIEPLPDGGIVLTFQVAGLAETARWVMGFGSHAEVLEPARLRAEIAAHIAALEKIYAKC